MRLLCLAAAGFALSLSLAPAQRPQPEDAVLAAFRQMERAEQTGDADTWIALWSSKSDVHEHADALRSMAGARPSVRYQVSKVFVQGDTAGLIGQVGDQYFNMRFVRESGAWKILDQSWSNVAIDPASIYALVPPPDGPFSRAGSLWQSVPRAIGNTQYYQAEKLRWKLQATYDSAYLYIRIEAKGALPAPDTELQGTFPEFVKSGVPRDWPIMKIRVLGITPREYTFDAADQVADKATFDSQGKAKSHHNFLNYSLTLWKGQQVVFTAGTGFTASPLVSVSDRFFDLRIPLKTLGIEASPQAIEIRDANGPIGMFAPYTVKPFGR